MLEVLNVAAGYGKKQVLFDVVIRAGKGETVAIIGPNGAGKSTVLKAVFGLVPVWNGHVRLGGRDITNRAPEANAAAGIAYVPQGNRVFRDLTARENLEVGGHLLGRSRLVTRRLGAVLDIFPSLGTRLPLSAAHLSAGEKQMLALGRALMLEPSLLLLDEPSLGLAPSVAEVALATIKSFARRLTMTVVLVEQNVREALAVADRAYGMKFGRIVFDAPAHALADDVKLRELFL